MHEMYKKKGRLEVICGPMFSGKSEELIRRLRRAKIAKQRVAVFKHAIDDRYHARCIASHNGTTLDAHPISNSSDMVKIVKKQEYTVVGIDEIQFYTNDIINTVCTLISWQVRIIAAGLDLDFRGVPFGPTPTLLALADSITKLRAICTLCGDDAHFSQRITPQKEKDDAVILVGDTDTYAARCRGCYITEQPLKYQNQQQVEQ